MRAHGEIRGSRRGVHARWRTRRWQRCFDGKVSGRSGGAVEAASAAISLRYCRQTTTTPIARRPARVDFQARQTPGGGGQELRRVLKKDTPVACLLDSSCRLVNTLSPPPPPSRFTAASPQLAPGIAPQQSYSPASRVRCPAAASRATHQPAFFFSRTAHCFARCHLASNRLLILPHRQKRAIVHH